MTNDFINLMKEAFANASQINAEKIRKIVAEASRYFREIQERFIAGGPEEREKAEKELAQIKELLEGQMEKLRQKTGMSSEELNKLADDRLGSEEKQALVEMKEEFREFQPKKEAEQKPRKRKKPKLRLIG